MILTLCQLLENDFTKSQTKCLCEWKEPLIKYKNVRMCHYCGRKYETCKNVKVRKKQMLWAFVFYVGFCVSGKTQGVTGIGPREVWSVNTEAI